MISIINYMKAMLPYILITLPIVIIIRIYKIKKNKKANWKYEITLLIFILFLIGLLSQAILKDLNMFNINNVFKRLNLIPFKVFIDTYKEVFINNNISYFIINFLGNIIMFIPIGFLIPLLWNVNNKKVILFGFLISLFIETSQLFINRGTDIDDLILNTFGTILGLLFYKLLKKIKN